MRLTSSVTALLLAGTLGAAGGAISGATAAASTAAPVQQAAVAVHQVYEMPARGRIRIVGHGYGHGHGMSQYGAEGAARQGKTWRQIVRFYYPGTRIATRRGNVRVLVSGDTSRDVLVSPRPGLRVRDTGTGKTTLLPKNGARLWRLEVARDGRSVVAYRTNRWRRFTVLRGDGLFVARGKPIRLHHSGTSTLYRGELWAARPGPRSRDRDTVNRLSVEHYLKGVVPTEMPATWSPAAVQAQSVAARTYARYEMQHPRARHYQICDTTACQVYGGRSAEHPASNAAVRATAHQILTHRGTPAFTQFSSSSGGWTSANQFPYLRAQQDPYDGWSGNPNHTWQERVEVARIERAFGIGDLRRIVVTRRDGNGQWRGRIQSVRLAGPKRSVTVSGDDLRFRLGLKSTWLTFQRR